MLIPNHYRNCVLFLSQPDEAGSQVPKGSAFLVADPATTGPKVEIVHLVTARHVVEAARATGKPLHIRGTSQTGGVATAPPLDFDAWHISETTDVAIFRNPPLDDFTASCLSLNIFADREYLDTHHIGPGDEVFFAGLFTTYAGSAHNEPIVRFGNISMMPREPVAIQNADGTQSKVCAFLVEARSWGGQSGSPAFVWLSSERNPGVITLPEINGPGKPLPLSAQPRLLGLVCGHFDISRDIVFKGEKDVLGTVRMNAGVAIVIPAVEIARELEAATSKS